MRRARELTRFAYLFAIVVLLTLLCAGGAGFMVWSWKECRKSHSFLFCAGAASGA